MNKRVNCSLKIVYQSIVSYIGSAVNIRIKARIRDCVLRLSAQLSDLKTYITHLNGKHVIHEILRPERRVVVSLSCIMILLLAVSFFFQTKGCILPVDKDVVHAFKMLKSTTSGRKLIEKVRSITRGSMVYLTIGNTERDNLMDEAGEKVRGLTRVDFRMSGHSCTVGRVTVITNRDMVGGDVYEIVKSLAFELENVYQVFNLSCACPWIDSPQAPLTQARVIEELGIAY